ncbi:unnamed protein product [Ophioblennius macclurei]
MMSLGRNVTALVVLTFSAFLSWSVTHGGKILTVPFDGSHWVNMNVMIKGLHSQGHSVDVIRNSKSWYIKDDSPYYGTITVPVREAFNNDFINPILKKIISIERGESPFINFLSLQAEMFSALSEVHRMTCEITMSMLRDENLMKSLKARRYDLLLTDPAWGLGILLAHALQLPLVYNVRWITGGEGHLAIAPSPLSYIPMVGSGLTDKMNFKERLKNFLFFMIWEAQDRFLIYPQYQAVCDQFFGPGVSYHELLRGADIWLMRVDFVFEFPRPTMPNVVYMGGFQCKPAEPLPQHLEEFVQSSGDHGFIIMSLGTLVSELPADLSNEIAATFAKLPQKVIWRYKGQKPDALGNNTLLVDWLPQNDLLGHPKIKLFVAHGGTNGLQEALYHGVPVVGIPLFFDQYDNLLRLEDRGGAKILTLSALDKDDNFFKAIQEVLTVPSYRANMQRLSSLHRDQPIPPMDNALFWIEFVMRHKGAAHLKAQAYRMSWFSYYSVDVVLFFLAIIAVIALVFRVLYRLVRLKKCQKQNKQLSKTSKTNK